MESNLTSRLVMPVGPVVAAFLTPVVQVMSGAAFLSTSDMRQAGPAVLPLTTAGHEPGVATGVLVEKPGGMLAEGSRQGHFFWFRLELHALYLDRSRDARPLPHGLTGHVARPLRSILHGGLLGAHLTK